MQSRSNWDRAQEPIGQDDGPILGGGNTTGSPGENGGHSGIVPACDFRGRTAIASRQTVLVVDDLPENLTILGELLQPLYRVRAASSGARAIRGAALEPKPDLILLDVMMPLMSGTKKARVLKSRERSRNIPILLMSSKEEPELRTLTAVAGADGYLPKPFSADRLVSKVRATLAA